MLDASLLDTTSMFYEYGHNEYDHFLPVREPYSSVRVALHPSMLFESYALIAPVLLQDEEDRLAAAPSPLTISLRSAGG